MIDLHYWTTPNGHKITMFLEETGLKYKIFPVNIGKGDQFKPEFLAIAPNNRIPAMVDHEPKGDGKGGNEADDFEPGGNQGIAGGHGDQGAPGGNPNSKNYVGGGHGNGGLQATGGLKGLKILSMPSFTDDFNQNATIIVNARVDANGNVVGWMTKETWEVGSGASNSGS